MADAIVSAAAERLVGLIEEQARCHINLIRGAEKKLRSLAVDLQNVRNVLNGAENRRFKDDGVNYWLSRLEQTAYEMEDVLDEWDYALLKSQRRPEKKKVCSFIPSSSCLCVTKVVVRHNIGKKILIVKEKLDKILNEKEQYGFETSQPSVDSLPASWRVQSTSMIDLTKVYGQDEDKELLLTKLMDNGGSQDEPGFPVLSIVGTGGLGKTTLAQMVYNHSRVEESFELRMWVCVSDPFDLAAIAKGILESIKVGSSPDTNNLDVLFKQVRESVSGRKFLLVLDDVWTEDSNKWEPLENSLRCGGAGSKILVTSRSERVVKMMGSRESDTCRPRLLSDEDCWSLLCRIALFGRNEVKFDDTGKEIAKKCKGLPLAVKTLGSLLQFQSSLEQWNNVLDSEIWQMEEVEVDLFTHLLLSYNELSPTLKRCFSYCAVFPKDTEINVDHLIQAWMALGYFGSNVGDMELKGRKYFDVLAMRSLFQDFTKNDLGEIQSCKMHDIVHDFAQFLKKRIRMDAAGMKNSTICRVCNPSHISMANEFCTLSCDSITSPKLCDCLIRLRVLTSWHVTSIERRITNFIHLRQLGIENMYLSSEDLKIIFQLYHLQNLSLFRCNIREIPKEIENLIHLRFLDLGNNYFLMELPESMCNLLELHTLNNIGCQHLHRVPEGLAHKLSVFPGGVGGSKLELLKNSKNLHGILRMNMRLNGDGDLNEVIQDARKAELRNEKHITEFQILFKDEMGEEGSSSLSWVWIDVLDALQPHPNLHTLYISYYGGSKLPRWMVSPINQLRSLSIFHCNHLTSLPPFGKLPCLEMLFLVGMKALEVMGRECLGITEEGEGDVIAFPKLKRLIIVMCNKWKEWEDITVEEAETALIMPCLTDLTITSCNGLTMLPHRLLRKVSSLKTLDINGSKELIRQYGDKEGYDWKSISINYPSSLFEAN